MSLFDKLYTAIFMDSGLLNSPLLLLVALLGSSFTVSGQLIHQGHAHNDYEQERPLFDALSYGFTSIEVDIHPLGRKLKVCHDIENSPQSARLKDLYFEPLDSIVNAHNGTVFLGDSTQLTLMIDLKTKKKKSLRQLHRLIKKYSHLFQKQIGSQSMWGPIVILISGEPPLSTWQAIDSPYMYLDGRDNETYPSKVKRMIRRVSDNIFTVSSNSALQSGDPDSLEQLSAHVTDLYSQNVKEVRFWSTTDSPDIWRSLLKAGVNIISVDNLKGFSQFIQGQK